MKNINQSSIGLVALASLFVVGCQRTEQAVQKERTESAASRQAERRDNALVRFVHAAPGTASVDVFFGEQPAFSSVGFKSATQYQELPGERREFRLQAGGQTVATNSEGLDDGDHYTLVALHRDDGTAVLRAFEDDLDAPSAGKAKVRIIHAASGIEEVDLVPTGTNNELFEGVDPNSATQYIEVNPMAGTLEVRKENENRVLLRIPDVNLEAGKIYTIVVTGGRNKAPLEVVRLEDRAAPRA
jgi:hypothetical protein